MSIKLKYGNILKYMQYNCTVVYEKNNSFVYKYNVDVQSTVFVYNDTTIKCSLICSLFILLFLIKIVTMHIWYMYVTENVNSLENYNNS